MNEKRMQKIIRRDKQRRTAQGIGAGFGVITSLAVLSLIFPESRKEIIKKLEK
ncbi:MAG: hypothetical protein KBS63_06645 [Clostridiales bacterium]|nr:hypothetical protein [Candidatus Crickella caballi]